MHWATDKQIAYICALLRTNNRWEAGYAMAEDKGCGKYRPLSKFSKWDASRTIDRLKRHRDLDQEIEELMRESEETISA